MMQKFFQLVIVFSLALIATNGAASQGLLDADPSIVHTEIPAKMGLAAPVAANDDTWTSSGPIGGYVTCLAIAPSDPNVMYAGTEGGIYKTSDGGVTWTWVGDIYMQYGDTPSTTNFATILDLQIAPDNPELIYAGTETGIYISQNGGRDWTNTKPGYVFVNSIAVDPSNPKNILIGIGRSDMQSDHEVIGIFKSTDGGETWVEKLPRESTGEELDSVKTIIFDTNDAQTVYAGTRKWDELGGYNSGLRKSIDGGETWSPLKEGLARSVWKLTMTPSGFSPATIYAYAGFINNDIYASTDQGTTWVPLGKPDSAEGFLVVDPGNAAMMYTSGPDSLYKYDSDTEQWTEIASGEFTKRPSSMVINPDNGDLFVGASQGGVYQSSDGGNQWVSLNFINTNINDLAVDPNAS